MPIIRVVVHEAKALSNISGVIKCRASIMDGSAEISSPQTWRSVEESTNPVFDDAQFSFDVDDRDIRSAKVQITIISGGDTVGTADVELDRLDQDIYERKL